MSRLFAVALVLLATAVGYPARAEVLIGVAGPMTGKDEWYGEQMQPIWYVWRGGKYVPLE